MISPIQIADSINIVVSLLENEWMRNCYCADLDKNGYVDIVTLRTSYARISNLEISFNDGKGRFVDYPLGINDSEKLPELRSLRAFPNPFEYQTNIAFNLRSAANVKLSVISSGGKLIASVPERRLSPGIHSVSLDREGTDVSRYAPGIYFLVLMIDGRMDQVLKILAE